MWSGHLCEPDARLERMRAPESVFQHFNHMLTSQGSSIPFHPIPVTVVTCGCIWQHQSHTVRLICLQENVFVRQTDGITLRGDFKDQRG